MATRRRPAELAEHTKEHVAVRELSRVLVVAPPWVAWPVALALALLLRKDWPGVLAGLLMGGCGLIVAGLCLHLTHHRKGHLGRYMAAGTALLGAAWLGWVVASGMGLHSGTFRTWLVGGGTLALCWSIWLHIHEAGDEAGMVLGFEAAAAKAGHRGLKVLGLKLQATKAAGRIAHLPGMTHEQLTKVVPEIESAGHLPPGTIVVTRNRDDAGVSDVVFSDPRTLHKPLPWPGPSIPSGGSIADPQRWGVWQDGSEILVTVPNWHEQVMAMTGAGKTLGAGYAELGETITRVDAFVVAIDIAKGRQFLGPLEGSLHALATEPDEAKALMRAVRHSIKPRTNYLGAKGLGNWERGCGLMHGTLWIEEAADVFEALGDEGIEDVLFPLLRVARSGGWRIVYSLHRASYDQMPTFLRSMVARVTMGVREQSDAAFGLSEQQVQADCSPELWADNIEDRGKTYIDAPPVKRAQRTMAGRFHYWGPTNEASARMATHAANYPAAARPFDEVTAPFFAGISPASLVPFPVAGPVAVVPREEDDDMAPFRDPAEPPDLDDDDLEDDGPLDLDAIEESETGQVEIPGAPDAPDATPASTEVAMAEFRAQLAEWRINGVPQRGGGVRHTFTIPDLRELRDRVGRSRGWLYTAIAQAVADGEITRNGDGGWDIQRKAA